MSGTQNVRSMLTWTQTSSGGHEPGRQSWRPAQTFGVTVVPSPHLIGKARQKVWQLWRARKPSPLRWHGSPAPERAHDVHASSASPEIALRTALSIRECIR